MKQESTVQEGGSALKSRYEGAWQPKRSQDYKFRIEAFLPHGQLVPDWESARLYAASLTIEATLQLAYGEVWPTFFDVDLLPDDHDCDSLKHCEPSDQVVGETWKQHLMDELEVLIESDYVVYALIIRRNRIGFVVTADTFEEVPQHLGAYFALERSGILRAAGYESAPMSKLRIPEWI